MLPQQQPNADPKIKGQIIYYLVLTFMADLHQDKTESFFLWAISLIEHFLEWITQLRHQSKYSLKEMFH